MIFLYDNRDDEFNAYYAFIRKGNYIIDIVLDIDDCLTEASAFSFSQTIVNAI